MAGAGDAAVVAQTCKERARASGGASTDSGRRRPLPNIASGNEALRTEAERQAVNTVIQGSAADLVKLAMVQVRRRHTCFDGKPNRRNVVRT